MFVYHVKQAKFDLMHNISFFSRIVFDEFIVKGGEIVHKVDWTLCYLGGWEKNMIMST
jgi:hypothetical protein